MLVVGVDAPDATNAGASRHAGHRATICDGLPPRVRDHLDGRVVATLETVVQHHVIEGLLEPDY